MSILLPSAPPEGSRTAREFLGGTPAFRTDLYSTGGTLLTHKESIDLLKQLGSQYTPELKGANRAARVQLALSLSYRELTREEGG